MAQYDRVTGDRDSVLVDTLKGAVAGGIAVWVMDQINWYMYDHEDPDTQRRTRRTGEFAPRGWIPHTARRTRSPNKTRHGT